MDYTEIPGILANLRENWGKLARELRYLRSRWFGLGRASHVVDGCRSQLTQAMLELYRSRYERAVQDIELPERSTRLTLLTATEWMPNRLLGIDDIHLELKNAQLPYATRNATFADRLRDELGRRVDNNTTFRLMRVESNTPSLRLSFSLGRYADYLNSSEALTWELALAARKFVGAGRTFEPRSVAESLAGVLPLRAQLDPFDFMNRSAAAGISTLTILAHSDHSRDVFLTHLRGTRQAEGSGTLHVVPAGMFQPLNQDNAFAATEFSLRRNVLREFGEELLDKEELIQEQGSVNPDQPFTEDSDLRALKDLFDTGGADLRFLGIGLDPVTLKPEILTLLIVDDDRRERLGIRYRSNWEGTYRVVAFSRLELIRKLMDPLVLSAGAGCLLRAVLLFDEVQSAVNELV